VLILRQSYCKFNKFFIFQNYFIIEIFSGAKLATKYLDKELAGRIQQIQLFGKNLKQDEHERLWYQLESEIHLHRHKTIIKACRQRNKVKLESPKNETNLSNKDDEQASSLALKQNKSLNKNSDLDNLKKNSIIGIVRNVKIKRADTTDGLGISITGGKEHGVPILISEVHTGGPVDKLFVGDAILSVNGTDLREALHTEAVELLSSLNGDVEFQVVFVSLDDESESETNVLDLNYKFIENEDSISNKLLINNNNNKINNSTNLTSDT
jgi:golgi-associated PDZ and coiled-coil motif-containing protein